MASFVNISGDYFNRFKDIVKSKKNALDILYTQLNPTIQNMERARKAALLSLVSGNINSYQRSGVHVLYVGDPGTAKSEILRYVAKDMTKPESSSKWTDDNWNMVGSDSSSVGLKYNANTKKEGMLNRCHRGVMSIDEFDKVDKGDRKATLEAMEEGEYEVNKGDFSGTLPAKVRVLAAANRTDNFRPEILDRFDFIINLSKPDRTEAKDIIHHIIDTFFEDIEDDANFLREYIKWSRDQVPDPEIPDKTTITIKKMYSKWLKHRYEKDEGVKVRGMISPFRIAIAIAQINNDGRMSANRFVEALDLYMNGIDEELRKELEGMI